PDLTAKRLEHRPFEPRRTLKTCFSFALCESVVRHRKREVLISGKHHFCVQVAIARRNFQAAWRQTFSCPGLFAEIGDQTVAAADFAHVLAGASINLVALCKVTDLPAVVAEQPVGKTLPYIPAAPVPKSI